MSQQLLNTIGLVFGIIGAIILFIYSPPQPSLEPGVGLRLESGTVVAGKTVAQHAEEALARRKLYGGMSKLA
jgi:hypothetical protein